MATMNMGYRDDSVEILADVEVPSRYYRRFKTGQLVLDEIFGGQELPGIAPFMSILFTGSPGAGKTTMVMQVADMLQKVEGCSILYNAGEQNKYIVKMNADRMGLRSNFAISHIGDVDKLIEYCKEAEVEVIIQDSIQTLSCEDFSGNKLIKKVGEKLAKFADDYGVLVILVGHITKGGDFAGPMQLKHTVDAHAHLSFNKETGNRIFQLKKNRMGPAMLPYEFFLGPQGMDFRQIEDPETATAKTKTYERKHAFVEQAKRMFLNGEELSGYPEQHESLTEWCEKEGWPEPSGGFWRGIIAKAKKELEREGHTIGAKKIDRREHLYLED